MTQPARPQNAGALPAPSVSDEVNADLDEAHRNLQDAYPELDWEGDINMAVSRALEMGFELGRDFEYRHPD